MAGCRRVVNVKRVKSPILFLVSEPNECLSLEQRKELLRFKDELTEVCTHLKRKKPYFCPALNDVVAVYCSDNERWERGRIENIYQTLTTVMYSVFLIDEGKSVNTAVVNICQLPDIFRHLPPQVYQIGLYGALPKEWSPVSTQKTIEEWSLKNRYFVEELLRDAEYVYFEKIVEIQGIYFGNVTVETGDCSLVDLTNKFCIEKIVKESTDFVKDIEHFYKWNQDKNSCVKETPNDNEDEKTDCLGTLTKLDMNKTSIAAIKDFIKQTVIKKNKDTYSTASSSSPKEEEPLQNKFTVNNVKQGVTTQHARNMSSDDSSIKYENPILKVDKPSDILYFPPGCTVEPDILKKEKEGKHVAAAKTRGVNLHNRTQFHNTGNSGEENWTETGNRRGVNRRAMDRENMNWEETSVRRKTNWTKIDNTEFVSHSETRNRRDTNMTEMNNRRGMNEAGMSNRRDANLTGINNRMGINWTNTNNGRNRNCRRDMNRTEADCRKDGNWAEAQNSDVTRSQMRSKENQSNNTNQRETGRRSNTNWAENKQTGDASHSGTRNRRNTSWTETNNEEDWNRAETSNIDTNWKNTNNRRDMISTYTGYEKDAKETITRSETKDIEMIEAEMINRGGMNHAKTNQRRNMNEAKNKNTENENHTETKKLRDTNWTGTNFRGDLNQAETNNERNVNQTSRSNRRDVSSRRDTNYRRDLSCSETKSTHLIGTEMGNRGGMHQVGTEHRQNMNCTENKNTKDVYHTGSTKKRNMNWTEVDDKGDINKADSSNRRNGNQTNTNNRKEMNRGDSNYKDNSNWSKTKNTVVTGTEMNSRGNMDQTKSNRRRNTSAAKNKNTEDGNHVETKNRKGTGTNNKGDRNQAETNNIRDVNWSDTTNRRDRKTGMSNRRDMKRTDTNYRNEDKNTVGIRTEMSNVGNMNQAETSHRRNINGAKNTSREYGNHIETKNGRDTDWTNTTDRRDMSRTYVNNRRGMNRAGTNYDGEMDWSESTGAVETDTRNRATKDVNHTEIDNRRYKNWSEIDNKGDSNQAEIGDRTDVIWTDATNKGDINCTSTNNRRDFNRTDMSWSGRDTNQAAAQFSQHNTDNKKMFDGKRNFNDSSSSVKSSSIENVTKIKNENSSNVCKNVNSALVETNTALAVNSVDIKAMSKLSVREMMNLLRQSKRNVETVALCPNPLENEETSKLDMGQSKINENNNEEPQLLDKDNQQNDMLQKTENIQSVVYNCDNKNDNNTEVDRKPESNMKTQIHLDNIENSGVEEDQQKCIINRRSSDYITSNDVKQPDDRSTNDEDGIGNKRITEKILKGSSQSPMLSTMSVSNFQSKESLDSDVTLSENPKHIYSDSTYFNYSKNIPVLLHGDCNCEPIRSVGEMAPDHFIFQCLQKWKVRDLTRVQCYACPVVGARRDIVIVSNPRSGKSLSYIVPILSLLRNKNYYSKLRPGNGPRAIFLVSCSVSGEQIYSMCKELIEPLKDLKICLTYGGGAEMEVKDELVNGCDVLISTPRCLQRLLQVPYLTSLNRVCHVVLDEADILLQNFLNELRKLIILLNKAKSTHSTHVQTVIASNTWSLTLEELVRQVLQNPVICIASYLEAAIYARVKPVVSILKPDQKIHKLLELLKSQSDRAMKTVILCNANDIQFVKQSVELIGVSPLVAHEEIDFTYSESIVASYWASDSPVVVCSDMVLPELNITDAQCLIHFGLPATKKQFIFRFSCLLQTYRSMFKSEDKQKCEVYIYVDEENENQLPEIMKFMERLGTVVPKILEEIVKKINLQKENSKGNVEICEDIKEFGKCWDVSKCPYRHTFKSDLDQPKNVPISGRVKLQILYIHNACHYSARILEHSTSDTWTRIPSDYVNLVMDINNYYCDPNNRCLHGLPMVGDIAAIETFFNIYERAQVLKITKYDYKGEPSAVLCKLLDNGSVSEYQVLKLLHLPENFRKQRPEAVDVYVCQLLPVDLDQNWSSAARMAVEGWVANILEQQTDSCIIGRIVLNIADSLWLEPLEHVKWLPLSKTFISQLSFRHQLLKIHLAVENKTHLDTLFQLCKEADINVPYYKGMKSNKEKGNEETVIKCQWAHLPRDEYTAVHVLNMYSLDMIFIQMVKFKDRLNLLEKDIEAAVNNKMEKLSFPSLKKDDICLGKYPFYNEWVRAQVVDDPTEQEVKVFLVDYGDYETLTWDSVLAIPAEIITRLPFQAIECSLAGVIPIEDEEANAVDLLLDLTTDISSRNLPKTMFAMVCNIDLKAQKTGGRRYSVVLVDTKEKEDFVINKEFVLEGFGNWHPKEKHFLNNLPPVVILNSDNSDSDNSSEISDIEETRNESPKETSDEPSKETSDELSKETTSTDLVVRNSTPQRSQEEADKLLDYLVQGLQNGTLCVMCPYDDDESFEKFEESTKCEEEENDSVHIHEFSDVSEEISDCTDQGLKQNKNIGKTTNELSDANNKTRQKDMVVDELQPKQLDPRNMEDIDLAAQKLNDSYSEMKQANSVDEEVSDPLKAEDIEPVVDELKDYYNEKLQTDIVDKELHMEESGQRKTKGIKSAEENFSDLCNENKQAHCTGKKLETGGLETWSMKDIDNSGQESYISCGQESYFSCVSETKLSCNSTDEFHENESILDNSETNTIENDFQIDGSDINHKINQSEDLLKYLSKDSLGTSDSEGKQSESESLSSQKHRCSSQFGLTEKLQSWFFDHMKTTNDSLEMQPENSGVKTVTPQYQIKHKERRRKISSDKTPDTDEESQVIDVVEDSHTSCKKPVADKVLQNITDETYLISSLAVEVPEKKGQSFIGMLQGWLGSSKKEKSYDTTLSDDQEMWYDVERLPDISHSEIYSRVCSGTSQNMDMCSSVLEEQCNHKAVSPGDRLCADSQNDSNTESSKLHTSLGGHINNTNSQTEKSELNNLPDNMLSELAASQQENKDINTKLFNFLGPNYSETEQVSNNENSSSQNQNITTDTSQCHHEYVDVCSDIITDSDVEAAGSQKLESDFAQYSNTALLSDKDASHDDESVLQSEEKPSGGAVQTSLPSSLTKEHKSDSDQFHNIFLKMYATEGIDIKQLPQLVEKDSLRPQVMWHQNLYFVWLHVLLHDVKKYKLLWTDREIYFRTVHDDRVYAFKMLLFGSVNPELLSHCAKGFHVEIKLVKTVQGYEWSRLLKTELKRPWVKVNLEAQTQFYSDDDEDAVGGSGQGKHFYVPNCGIDARKYDHFSSDETSTSASDDQEYEPVDSYEVMI